MNVFSILVTIPRESNLSWWQSKDRFSLVNSLTIDHFLTIDTLTDKLFQKVQESGKDILNVCDF